MEYSGTSSIIIDWYDWAHSLNLFTRQIFNPCANEFYVHPNLGGGGNTTHLDDSQVTKECFCIWGIILVDSQMTRKGNNTIHCFIHPNIIKLITFFIGLMCNGICDEPWIL